MADKQLWEVTPQANDIKNDDGVIIGGRTAGTRFALFELIKNYILGGSVQEAVDDWLDEHPEATTTVQDNSITDSKLAPSIKFNRGVENSEFGYKILSSAASLISQIVDDNTIYEIRWDFDLDGQSLELPSSVVLIFNGGSISNGTIVGQNSVVEALSYNCFKNIVIDGTWKNTKVSSYYFEKESYSYDKTMLRSLVKLGGGGEITIESSEYLLNIEEDEESIIKLDVDETVLIVKGSLKVNANEFDHYTILAVEAENCVVDGGDFVGDVETHTGATGEWGHGVAIRGAKGTIVKNGTFSYFWGDGIVLSGRVVDGNYVHSENTLVDNVVCSYNRRLGLSVTASYNAVIRNSRFIKNGTINGTLPKSGIDIESNEWTFTDNISIEGCEFIGNAVYGFIVSKYPLAGLQHNKTYSVSNCRVYNPDNANAANSCIISNNCIVDNVEVGFLEFNKASDVVVRNSTINQGVILSAENENIKFEDCDIFSKTNTFGYISLVIASGANPVARNVDFVDCRLSLENVSGVGNLISGAFDDDSDINLKSCLINASSRSIVWYAGNVEFCKISCLNFGLNNSILHDISYIGNMIYGSNTFILLENIDAEKTITISLNRIVSKSANSQNIVNYGAYTATISLIGNITNKSNQELYGNTANRPVNNPGVGTIYYDSQIKKFIRWNGSVWLYDDGFSESYARIGSSSQYPTVPTGNSYKMFRFFDYSKQKWATWDGNHWRDANGFYSNRMKGTSSERPTLDSSDGSVGYWFFDTTLGKMIVWDGSNWINMDGSSL